MTPPFFTDMPEQREDCWATLANFLDYWHGEVGGERGYPEASIAQVQTTVNHKLPSALREWLPRFAKISSALCDRARNVHPAEMRDSDGVLVLRTEKIFNGLASVSWGVLIPDLDRDDPPVVSLMVGNEPKIWGDRLSDFFVYCVAFDTCNSLHTKGIDADNDFVFPSNGSRMQFPDHFGIIKTRMYEGNDWIAMVSGTDCYLRIKRIGEPDAFVKHEVRTEEDGG
ncbi:hypothetical protein SH528x_006012 [Novipirellula sp. SH528]|uniref:hypothetical protein n=1 Tax=Novipirellula sp. SH528 TaxID=3454466 RepID=UPI003F9F175C